jgi:hypothetical protein
MIAMTLGNAAAASARLIVWALSSEGRPKNRHH